MARKLDTAAPSRRDFLKTAGLFGGMAAAGWPAPGLYWIDPFFISRSSVIAQRFLYLTSDNVRLTI